jgi:hypothetical protein
MKELTGRHFGKISAEAKLLGLLESADYTMICTLEMNFENTPCFDVDGVKNQHCYKRYGVRGVQIISISNRL